jgi:hypothetical protein
MKKIVLSAGMLSVMIMSNSAMAAPGEWWDVTGKMEMEGMPFAMPAQTSKVCIPKGGEGDPKYSQGKDKNCKMTDVSRSGNTIKFKGSCVNRGETMNMAGESTHDANSFKSNMKMSGKSEGRDMEMTMVTTGKRVGGSCDTEELAKKAQAQMDGQISAANEQKAQVCDTSKMDSMALVGKAGLFFGTPPFCPGKKDVLCKAVRNDGPRQIQVFESIEQQEKNQSAPIAKECKVNIESMRKTLCHNKANQGPLEFLESYCPSEAKAYRELLRKREACSGRGFTGGAKLKQCMGGQMIEAEEAGAHAAKSGKAGAETEAESSGSGGVTTDSVLDGAKKLKGLLGF